MNPISLLKKISTYNRDLLLRLHFSLFYFFSTLMWLNFDWLNSLLPYSINFLAADLGGHQVGLEPTFYLWHFEFVRNTPIAKYLVLLLALVASYMFLKSRYVSWGASLLVILSQILGYSTAGRMTIFDMVSYSLLGYWAAAVVAPIIYKNENDQLNWGWLRWNSSAAAFGATYTSAAISKYIAENDSWANPWNTGVFMHLGRIRYEHNLSPFYIPDSILYFFSTPTIFSTIWLYTAIALEGLAVFLLFFRTKSRLGIWLFLLIHLGILITVNVIWIPLILLWVSFALTWQKPILSNSKFELKFSFTILILLLVLSWTLPENKNHPASTTTLFFPFSRSKMYSRPQNYTQFYYLANRNGQIISQSSLIGGTSLGTASMNLMIRTFMRRGHTPLNAAKFLCSEISNRISFNPRYSELKKTPISIWKHHIDVDNNKNIKTTNYHLLDCN